MSDSLSRRRFLGAAVVVPVGMAASLSAWQSAAIAATATPAAPATTALRPLTSDDPRVGALGYVSDAAKAKADPMYKAGSQCGNCAQLKGKVGDKLRPCALFPDLKNPKQMLLVPTTGWCRSWTAISAK